MWKMVLEGATFNDMVVVGVVSLLLFRLPMAQLWAMISFPRFDVCIIFLNHTFCTFSEGRYENVRDVVFYGCDEVQGQKSGFRAHNPIQKLVGVMEENPVGHSIYIRTVRS